MTALFSQAIVYFAGLWFRFYYFRFFSPFDPAKFVSLVIENRKVISLQTCTDPQNRENSTDALWGSVQASKNIPGFVESQFRNFTRYGSQIFASLLILRCSFRQCQSIFAT